MLRPWNGEMLKFGDMTMMGEEEGMRWIDLPSWRRREGLLRSSFFFGRI